MVSGLRTPETIHTEGVGSHHHDSGFFARFSGPVNDSRAVARHGDTLVSETQLRARTRAWRDAIASLPNDAVALFEPNGVEFAAALCGAWYAGKQVYLPGDARAATCTQLAQLGVAFAGAFPAEFNPVSVVPSASSASHALDGALDADALHLVIYTSGSTGAPQALRKRLSQLLAEVDALEQAFGEQLGDCEIVATVSHQHIYGLLFKILLPIATRRTFVATSAEYPEEFVAALQHNRSALVSGPAHLKRLPETLNWARARENTTVVFSSGGPLAIDAVNSVESLLGTAPMEVYGSSETGGVAWRQRSQGVEQKWTPLPGVVVREQDDCLAVRSRHLADDHWFVVADRVHFDVDGRFELRGRADRIAKIEGKRVSLAGIEDALVASKLVSDARVVVLQSARDELGAVIVPNNAGWTLMRDESPDSLRSQLTEIVAQSADRIARPRKWRILDSLPANSAGKTTQESLQHLFAPRALELPATHLVERTDDRVELELYVSSQLLCFDGHFASLPVLPGVAQLDWATVFGRTHFAIAHEFERMEAVKFQRLYRPGPLLSLHLEWRDARNMLSFRYVSSEGPHSSGRILFTR